jgi:predicted dehydrogenase
MLPRRWKASIAGFGSYAETGHLPAYLGSSWFQLAAVCDPVPARRRAAEQLARVSGCESIAVYESIEEMLRADSEIVDICSPPALHFEQARVALRAGKHVLCEKPVVPRIDLLRQLRNLSQPRGLRLLAGHNYRFSPAIQRFVELAPRVGTGARLQIDILRTGAARGTPEWHPHWRCEAGILMDHGPHAISLACWLAGEPPLEIAAWDGTDTARIELVFGRMEAHIALSWKAPARHTEYRVTASGGELALRDYSSLLLQLRGEDPTVETFPPGSPALWTRSMLAAYGGMLPGGPSDAELWQVTEALELAAVSSQEGGRRLAFAAATTVGESLVL